MSLTSRLTAFFLGALALVLIGFSTALYLVARETLSRQTDDRLEAALHALMAAVEMDRGALEWEPFRRKLSLGEETDADEVRWTVRDERGLLVDRARNVGSESFLVGLPSIREAQRPRLVRFKDGGRSWRVAQTRLDSSRPPGRSAPHRHHASLILTAAIRCSILPKRHFAISAGCRRVFRWASGFFPRRWDGGSVARRYVLFRRWPRLRAA